MAEAEEERIVFVVQDEKRSCLGIFSERKFAEDCARQLLKAGYPGVYTQMHIIDPIIKEDIALWQT